MRRRLAFLSLAVSSLVVLAFLIPLGILVRNQAENRALTRGERFAESIAAALAITGARDLGVDGGEVVLQAFGSPAGTSIVYPSGAAVGAPIADTANLELAREGAAFTARIDGGAEVLVPVLTADSPAADSTVVVRAFIPDEELSRGVTTAWLLLLGLGVFLVLVAVAAADRLGRSIVRPVTDLSRAARKLGEGDLTTRVVPQGPAEIAEVGVAFNFLAGRLGGLLEAERESVADLSHRLRTPLTALRLQAETLADPTEAETLLADIDRMERAVDSMIAEARRAPAEPRAATTDLGKVLKHRAAFWQVLADEQGRPTSVLVGEGPHLVAMAESELGALVDVLIENVFAHTEPPTGYIVRVGDHEDGTTFLVVEDDGPGFRDLSVLRRGMSSRGSSGLGLDIVARAAERAGGGFKIGNSRGGGAQVVVRFGPVDQTVAAPTGDRAPAIPASVAESSR
jgi:signal transduction histidine kinase